MDRFESVDINNKIGEIATTLYRNMKEEDRRKGVSGRNDRKLGFDIFHVATAHRYGLLIESSDPDIARLQTLIADLE